MVESSEQGERENEVRRGVASAARALLASASATTPARKAEAFAVCLLLLMAANCLTVIARKSVTNDENIHIPAGYYHLVRSEERRVGKECRSQCAAYQSKTQKYRLDRY